jgi:hypothetical protein
MNSTLYDRIREENERKYGTQVSVYGPVLLANLYSDRTHFIYELLQNAEDACERAKRQGQNKEFRISFDLYPDRLEVRHNGIPFDEKDARGICGIVGSADKGLPQIGKFGIGFKSVYAYTVSPEVYSGDKSFYIKDYVYPYLKESRKDVQEDETLFVILFNNEKVKSKTANSEIEKRLRDLGLRTLLFLKNIEKVSYWMDREGGEYLRKEIKRENGARWISLYHLENKVEKANEKWLVLDKPLNKDENRKLEIAYQIIDDPNLKKEKINPARDVKLFAYFPTEKETHLRFLIQGPYNTTPARDNIRIDDEWNQRLVEETAELVVGSILKVKALNMLDAEFLNTLPIDTEHFTKEDTIFRPIYQKIKEKLFGEEALLPSCDGNFVNAESAFIARGKDLCSLLTSEQLDVLFDRAGSKWLDENITEARMPELRRYLIDELWIKEVDPELFARELDEEFMSKQSDQWVISFYAFLSNQRALWRASTHSYEKPSILRSKPIIRLDNDSHIAPFKDEKPLVYLPHKDLKIKKYFSNVVKDVIANDKTAREFLKTLGIDEPDKVAAIIDVVLPCYNKMTPVPEKENIRNVEWILKTMDDCEGIRKSNLLNKLSETPFLYAINASNQQKEYRKPIEVHLGEKYAGSKDLEIYFEGNEEIWFLDERYLTLKDTIEIPGKIKDLGCKSEIQVVNRKPDSLNHVIIHAYWGMHARGLNGFDPECVVEGLEHALENVNIERSKILWHVVKEHRRSICGEVESSARKDYADSTKERKYSGMGELLAKYPWLPDSKSHSFHKPSEIMLSELPDDFDKESPEAKYVSDKLGFKQEVELEKLLEKTPNQAKEIVQIFMTASPEVQQRMLESVRAIKSTSVIEVSPSSSELEKEFKRALAQERPPPVSSEDEDKTWTGPTPEEVEKMQELSLEMMKELSKRHPRIKIGVKETSYRETEEKGEPMLRAFLLEQYKGHCQVCNVKLDLGPNKDPYFEIYRLMEKRRLRGAWSDQEYNALCLCPNCHALMKHGGSNLENVEEKAKKMTRGEDAPEEVSERKGDFYIIPITVAGKARELFYTPFHMAKVSAFIKWLRTNYK